MAAPDAPTDTSALLWYTDRSRYKQGTARCAMARYLGYHFGPTGYGITAHADSLPLATGLYVHQGVEGLGKILQQHDRLPTLEETRGIVQDARGAYLARVADRGFRGILSGAQTDETITEQSALISGLLWALVLKFLPWLHATYRVLSVEQERLHLLDCTCGAGALPAEQHVARGCQGTALMLRNDLIAQRRGGTTLAYFEVKTTGWESSAWAEQWETDPQLGLGTLDVPSWLGAEVTELYIIGLNKGSRKRDWKAEDDSRKKQQSALCYGYCRPSNPPLLTDDWLPSYEWVDDLGETKRASRAHKRRGVWELEESDWSVWQAYRQQDPALTPEEFWVRFLPPSVLEKVCFLLGPMNRQDAQIKSVRQAMSGEEARWRATLWTLYELQAAGGVGWATDAFQAKLAELVPASWNCRPFGKDHQCEFTPICHRYEGWEDPLGTGRFVPRQPHHEAERVQAVARGLLPDVGQRVEEDE